MNIRVVSMLLALGLAGCAPTIDGSSWEAHKDSIEEAKAELAPEDRINFASTAMRLARVEVLKMEAAGEMTELRDDALQAQGQMRALDGKTAAEVLALRDYSVWALQAQEARSEARRWQERYDREAAAAEPDRESMANYKQYIDEAMVRLANSEAQLKKLQM